MGRIANHNIDRSVASAAATTPNRLTIIANRIAKLQTSLDMPTMTPDQRDNRIAELQASLGAGAPTTTPDTPTPTPDQIAANQIAIAELQASLGMAPTTAPDRIAN
jgi:hypothetical protein